jgi:acetyl-CoA synthetase (ADP-forming)
MHLIDLALEDGRTTLSEYESKKVLAYYGIPVTAETLVDHPKDLSEACRKIGFPLVMKGCAAQIAHKTEKGLIRVDLRNEDEALKAFKEITSAMDASQKAVLVQQMIKGQRELVVGLTRDPQFGPCVMFGLGGIFTEILEDTSFRIAPIEKRDALEMMAEIKGHKILEAIRGMQPVDKDILADILIAIGNLGIENDAVEEVDINPVIISGGKPVAVDALVVLSADGKHKPS